ncbi:MAG TPA: family 43 glycosylhydrolase [Arachidicoccus sp.]|nr:family 43 glycosylhydrolase [Arachidicoccus sp.]
MGKSIQVIIILLLLLHTATGQNQKAYVYDAIYAGVPWFDDHGKVLSAHGANIVKDNERYYLFGEAHSDTSNAFIGFNCYSSADLYNWKFESIALPVQRNGKLGPNRVGERPKVMRCPTTGEYVMFMHVDTLGYKDQFVGYATAKRITGPYLFQGPIHFNGKPVRKWDMGTFQDQDGSGYILLHGGDIYKLSRDYKSITEQVHKAMTSGFESPAIFRKDSIYYFLGSNLTSWEKNDNYYYTATALKGPWTRRGIFAPEGTLTWNSQTTFVLPIQGSKAATYLFMGDRWSYPKQASAATYVWQPISVSGYKLSIPDYQQAWQVNTTTGVAAPVNLGGDEQEVVISNTDNRITYIGKWLRDTLSVRSSDAKDAHFSIEFTGQQIGWYGLSRPDGGYAKVTIKNSKGITILSSIIDSYCKYTVSELKFISPVLPKDKYTITVSVMRERGNWSDKRKRLYGSTGYFISLDKFIVKL